MECKEESRSYRRDSEEEHLADISVGRTNQWEEMGDADGKPAKKAAESLQQGRHG